MLLKFVVSLRRYTCYKRTNDTGIWKTISEILDKLLENYIELYQYWISFSHNIKIGGGGREVAMLTKSKINYLQKAQP